MIIGPKTERPSSVNIFAPQSVSETNGVNNFSPVFANSRVEHVLLMVDGVQRLAQN
jgi:hypothetical protein